MKRVLLFAVLALLILGMSAFAADAGKKMPMAFGIKAGISLATTAGDSLTSYFDNMNNKSRFGMAGGVFFAFTPVKSITIQPELLYVQKGTKLEAISGTGKMTAKVDYLEIPVLCKFTPQLQNSKIAPTIFAGPFLGLRMTGKLKGEEWIDDGLNGELDIKDSLKSTDFGITFGGGLGYKLAKGELFFDLRYDLGLSKIVKQETFHNGDFDTKTSALLVFIGYKFDM
jgi:hypothetical protein